MLKVFIEPEYKDGKQRVIDCYLDAAPMTGKAGVTLDETIVSLRHKDAEHDLTAGLNNVLSNLQATVAGGHDPFVTIRLDGGLPLGAVHEFCALAASIETEKGIRVEPPGEGHLYFKAFLPDEAFRHREKRVAQPWELRLSSKDAGTSGVLTHIEQLWRDDRIRPDLKPTHYSASSGSELRDALATHGPGLAVIFVFAPPSLTYGRLMDFVRPALPTHPTIHVFLEDAAP